jgi:hypothetical protein
MEVLDLANSLVSSSSHGSGARINLPIRVLQRPDLKRDPFNNTAQQCGQPNSQFRIGATDGLEVSQL